MTVMSNMICIYVGDTLNIGNTTVNKGKIGNGRDLGVRGGHFVYIRVGEKATGDMR